MTLREKYTQAVAAYALTVENWNACVERSINLPDQVWAALLEEMEYTRLQADKAWKDYLYNEIFA